MKYIIAMIALALLAGCSAPMPKPCDASFANNYAGAYDPCGPEIEINASYRF